MLIYRERFYGKRYKQTKFTDPRSSVHWCDIFTAQLYILLLIPMGNAILGSRYTVIYLFARKVISPYYHASLNTLYYRCKTATVYKHVHLRS